MGLIGNAVQRRIGIRERILDLYNNEAPLQGFEFRIEIHNESLGLEGFMGGALSQVAGGVANLADINTDNFIMTDVSYPDSGLTWSFRQEMIGHPVPGLQYSPLKITFNTQRRIDARDELGLTNITIYEKFLKIYESQFVSAGPDAGVLKIPNNRPSYRLDIYLKFIKSDITGVLTNEHDKRICTLSDIRIGRITPNLTPQGRDFMTFTAEILYKNINFSTSI